LAAARLYRSKKPGRNRVRRQSIVMIHSKSRVCGSSPAPWRGAGWGDGSNRSHRGKKETRRFQRLFIGRRQIQIVRLLDMPIRKKEVALETMHLLRPSERVIWAELQDSSGRKPVIGDIPVAGQDRVWSGGVCV